MSDDEDLGFENGEQPSFIRAAYADDRLTMVHRHPWFPTKGVTWARPMLEAPESETVIADLTIVRDRSRKELIVEELSNAGQADFRMTLMDWAKLLGYRRIWIGLDVLDLGEEPFAWDIRVTTQCFGCKTEWRSDQMGFLMRAREAGSFPNVCALCGGLMPVWAEDRGPLHVGRDREPRQRQLPGLDAS